MPLTGLRRFPEFADDLALDPNAFLSAALIPAMYYGEKWFLVEGKLCPLLRDWLIAVMQQLRVWYGEVPVEIEATEGFGPSPIPEQARTASCMSGGVDSLASFRNTRLSMPLGHSVIDQF